MSSVIEIPDKKKILARIDAIMRELEILRHIVTEPAPIIAESEKKPNRRMHYSALRARDHGMSTSHAAMQRIECFNLASNDAHFRSISQIQCFSIG